MGGCSNAQLRSVLWWNQARMGLVLEGGRHCGGAAGRPMCGTRRQDRESGAIAVVLSFAWTHRCSEPSSRPIRMRSCTVGRMDTAGFRCACACVAVHRHRLLLVVRYRPVLSKRSLGGTPGGWLRRLPTLAPRTTMGLRHARSCYGWLTICVRPSRVCWGCSR